MLTRWAAAGLSSCFGRVSVVRGRTRLRRQVATRSPEPTGHVNNPGIQFHNSRTCAAVSPYYDKSWVSPTHRSRSGLGGPFPVALVCPPGRQPRRMVLSMRRKLSLENVIRGSGPGSLGTINALSADQNERRGYVASSSSKFIQGKSLWIKIPIG